MKNTHISYLIPLISLFSLALASTSATGLAELDRRNSSSNCPETIKSPWQIDFNIYCNTDQPGWDSTPESHPGSNITDCIDQCMVHPGPCLSVVFRVNEGVCHFKNGSFAYDKACTTADTDAVLAAFDHNELPTMNVTCPYTSLSSQQSEIGQNFTVHCDTNIVGSDLVPRLGNGYAEGSGFPFWAPTLAACMALCSTADPLCWGVSWNPDMMDGYANCYFKTKTPDAGFVFSDANGVGLGNVAPRFHSAEILYAPATNTDGYKDGNIVHYQDYAHVFVLKFNTNLPGNDIVVWHNDTLADCMDQCRKTSGCAAVAFDTTLEDGYRNCRLKNTTGPSVSGSENTNWVLATVEPSDYKPPSPPSRSWIAGIVIGALAVIGAAAALAWFLRLRRQRGRDTRQSSGVWKSGFFKIPMHGSNDGQASMMSTGLETRRSQLGHQPFELEIPTVELADNKENPHELPAAGVGSTSTPLLPH